MGGWFSGGQRGCWFLLVSFVIGPAAAGSEPAGAAEPLVGDRPDFTESAVAVAPNRLQVEAGITHLRAGDARLTEAGELLLRLGLQRGLELRVGLGSWIHFEGADGGDIDGFTDFFLGAKLRFLEGAGIRPGLAVLAGASVPTGRSEFSSGTLEPEAILAAEWELSPTLGLSSNLGAARVGAVGRHAAAGWLSVSLGWRANEHWGAFCEGYGFTLEDKDGPATAYGDLGVTYLVGPDLQFDARVGRGFNGGGEDWFAGAGIVVRR